MTGTIQATRARDNPFRTERILQMRYRLKDVTLDELLTRFERMRSRAAVIGPHGSGKTTLLEDFQLRLHEKGFGTRFIRLDEEQSTFSARFLKKLFSGLTARDILLVDGAEQMSPVAWRWFRWRARKIGGLIITTHRAGRLPTLWECRTSPALLAGIATDLLGVESGTILERAERLFEKYHGNLREALREWYDLAAQADLAHNSTCCPLIVRKTEVISVFPRGSRLFLAISAWTGPPKSSRAHR